MADYLAFGQRIKQYRKALDLTQEDFAERVGCSIETISKIERGERRPSKQVAERMAQVLELPAEERANFVRAARGAEPPPSLAPSEPPARGAPPAPPAPQAGELVVAAPHKRRASLPAPPTALVGRAAELAELDGMLADPSYRLVTLTGPGGIGKTRLAIEAASRHAAAFDDGAAFVHLAAVPAPNLVAAAIANALGFDFYGASDPDHQLLDYLRDKSLLLVLDNFEHLIAAPAPSPPHGADLLADIVRQARGVKLIVTSRERLNLHGEWVFELRGLALPRNEPSADFDAAGAVALFLQAARRARAGFTITPAERACVARICRLVEGMPLAIELAAAWVRVLPCDEIAREIEQTIDFLAASARDVPARHRSLRAVFEHSWNLLTDDERAALRTLSVFRGGFRREAAEWVAGATLPLLTALVDKSLLRRSNTGRYDIHELVRQYAAAQLEERPAEYAEVRERHSGYYLTLVQHREKALKRARQRAVIAELETEIDNIRLAWDWAVRHARARDLRRALRGLSWFYELRSWFAEGEAMMAQASQALASRHSVDHADFADSSTQSKTVPALSVQPADQPAERTIALGQLMTFEGWFRFRQGRYGPARELVERAAELLRPHGDQAALADALTILGWAANHMGDYQAARAYLQEGLELARAVDEPWMVVLALGGLGMVAHELGDYAEAERLCRAGLDAALALGSVRAVAFSISALSSAALALGQYDEAQTLLRASFTTSSTIGDYWAIGSALTQLGLIALVQADHAEARYMFREALATFREIGERWSMARALDFLGTAAAALGDESAAWHAYQEAWRIAIDAQVLPVALDALHGMASLAAKWGEPELAAELAAHIARHPATGQPARGRAERLRAKLGAPASASHPAARPQRSLHEAIDQLFTIRR